jgi:hypothetical protein
LANPRRRRRCGMIVAVIERRHEERRHPRGISTMLTARLRILVAGLLAVCSCSGNGLRTLTARDAGGTRGSGGVIATGGTGGASATGGSGGASSTQSSTSNRTLGANQCRGNADCNSRLGATCVPPGGATPCGVCLRVTPCSSDSECQADGASLICDVASFCTCPLGAKSCVPGCVTAAGCSTGEACIAQHCVPASCQSDVDCPTDFECTGGSCGRKSCTTDADCGGYCVSGACYSTPGTCYGAVA